MRSNKIILMLCLSVMNFTVFKVVSTESIRCGNCDYAVESLDITSFRPTQSLQEDVHERIVEFLADLQQDKITFSDAAQELDGLYHEVNSRLGSTSFDTIRSEDRDYLLQMIEQIDELIATLEKEDSSRVVELKDSCEQLKNLFL